MGFEAATMTQGNPIPTSWSLVKVGEVADINKSTISINNAPKWIEYIDISSVGERRIDPPIPMEFSSSPSRARRRVSPGDILISTVRPNLKHFIYLKKAKENWVASTGFAVVSAKPKVDSCYLYYYLTSEIFTEYLIRVADGGAYPAFNPSEIKNAELLLPPPLEQKAIAHILGTLDDKIELNQQMNRNLEAITSAIFKSWFVDFDPVRAKMEGRQPAGIDAAIAAFFPDSFETSQIGEIPKGWRVFELSELCRVGRGASPRPINDPRYLGGSIPWIKIADATKADGPFLFETKEGITEAGRQKSVFLKKGSLILSNSATCGLPIFLEIDGCIHDGWLYFENLKLISPNYLYQVLSKLANHLIHIADGSVQKNLNTKLVGSQIILVPDNEILSHFETLSSVIFNKVRENGRESRTLATIRDTLLSKLMSGEIRVKEAEKILEDVV